MPHDSSIRAGTTFPSLHRLRAAVRAGRGLTIPTGTLEAEAHASYAYAPTEGLFSAEELLRGEELLIEAGLISREDARLVPAEALAFVVQQAESEACEAIAVYLLDHSQPLWITAATAGGILSSELLPDEVLLGLQRLLPDPRQRELFLLGLGQRVDEKDAKLVGDLAERCVVEACRAELDAIGRSDLASMVKRVSLISDQLGYDVTAPRLDESVRRLEVKGTRRSGPDLAVTLSRNEADVGARDPDWYLVVCRISPEGDSTVVGWCNRGIIASRLPTDPLEKGFWRAASVSLDVAELTSGLPGPVIAGGD